MPRVHVRALAASQASSSPREGVSRGVHFPTTNGERRDRSPARSTPRSPVEHHQGDGGNRAARTRWVLVRTGGASKRGGGSHGSVGDRRLLATHRRDNVGLLVDTWRTELPSPCVVFVTNDLTERVLLEATRKRANVIVTYHPTPFSATRTLVRRGTRQAATVWTLPSSERSLHVRAVCPQ